MVKVWNADLAHACEVRVWYHMSKGSSKEFMWRKAHQAILAVDKEIRQFSSGRVVNMPKIKEVTTLHELEAIIRGEKAIVPPEMQQAAEPPERDYAQHPYLKRMQFRGGGYAILMALHLRSKQTGHRQFMYKSEILHDAQPFCDGIMEGTWGSANGWTSIRSLLSHRLVLACRGPFGGEEYRLTQEGISFIEAMLELWPERNASVDHAVGQEFTQGSQAIEMTPAVETTQAAPRYRRPRWAAQTFRVCTAPTPLSKRRRSEGYVNVESIDISSESEFERPSCCEASDGNTEQQESQVVLLVDDRERLRNLEPRRFFESIAAEAMACRHHLKLGDFAWVLQPASPATPAHCLESVSMSLNHCPLVNLLVERKRIADLVGRSAVGDHLKQLRRMEDSALQHLFFLIEGNLKHASNCTVYDTETAEMESICLGSKEDIDAFCAKLIVLGSKVGVLQTKDSAGTVRLLKNISAWLAWTLCSDKQSEKHGALLTSCTLQNLQTVPAGPQDLARPAWKNAEGVQTSSSSLNRSAEMVVSQRLFVRMNQPANTAGVVWHQNDELHLCGELMIVENEQRSESISFVILEAGLLVEEIIKAEKLVAAKSTAAVAEAAAMALVAQLPYQNSNIRRRRLLIVEGLSKAVQACTRSGNSTLAPDQILPCAELATVLVDVRCSWRCRVHNSEPAETTKSFLQVLLRVALSTDSPEWPEFCT